MILETLHSLHGRLEKDPSYGLPPAGYSIQKITFKVVLHPDGRLFSIEDARLPSEGRLRPQLVLVPGETKDPGSGLNPCFLWDKSAYLLGFEADETKRARAPKAFAAFRDRHLALRGKINSPEFAAVCDFLSSWEPSRASQFPVLEEAAATGFGCFQILGSTGWVHEEPAIASWWQAKILAEPPSEAVGECLVTGDVVPIARTHPKIKGVAGTQGAGAPLVGFNASAFESYGRDQSHNAPVGEEAARRYAGALNALIDGPKSPKHRAKLGELTVAFWTEQPSPVEDIFARFIAEGDPSIDLEESQDEALRARLKAFLEALRKGRSAFGEFDAAAEQTPFYLLGLAPNIGRVSVRFFHRSSVADLLENLHRHHRDIELDRRPAGGNRPGDPEFPSPTLLLGQTARESKDIPPVLVGPLLAAIVGGGPYPAGLFTAVVRRIRADRDLTYPRLCVVKGYLNRNHQLGVTMSLDKERRDPAYRLGRLFAALEKTQKDALGEGLNATIRDSYYGSASATPAVVFPRLLRLYQHHLSHLEGGWRVNRERLVQEVLGPLEGFPAHFGLVDQGLFALGYYHQMRDFYTKQNDSTDN